MIQIFDPKNIQHESYIRISGVSPKDVLSSQYQYFLVTSHWKAKTDVFKDCSWFSGRLISNLAYLCFTMGKINSFGEVTFDAELFQPKCTYLLEHCELSDIPFWTRLKAKRVSKKLLKSENAI